MKSNQTLSLLFWHRKSKADAMGYAPIICRISIDGLDAELSTGQKVHLEKWDLNAKKAMGGPEAKKINSKICQIQAALEQHFIMLQTQHAHITPLMLKNAFNNLPTDHQKGSPKPLPQAIPTLLQLADKQILDFSKMVAKGLRSKETLKQWKATKNKIQEFIRHRYKHPDIELREIDFSFAQKFYDYLTLEREIVLQDAAAKKQIKNTKQILNLAETNQWLDRNPLEKFKCGAEEAEILPLELYEVEKMWYKKLIVKRLEKVRDAFIFQCFTGFAYQDIYALSPEHIVQVGSDGERWLIKERGKTKVTEMVPILPIVEDIIEKYKDDSYCRFYNRLIPVNNNYRYNCYLKELADICDIHRSLNTHLARHTFADIMLNVFNFPLEDVSKMLGHKTVRTTQRYARIKKQRISKQMRLSKSILFHENGELRKIML